jgi:glycine oxidase
MTSMKSVVIVGGGVIGLFCAVRLAKAGARVTVLEAEGEHADLFGPGASAAAAGMLAPLGESASPHDGVALASFDRWRQWQDGAEWGDGVRFAGGVVVARDGAEAVALVRRAERLGRRASVLSAAQFAKHTGFRAKVEHAVFVEDEGVADPLRVLSGLAMQARAHGVLTEYHADVAAVTAHSATTVDERVFEADTIILSPGVWATEKLQAAAPALRHIRPAKGHVAAVQIEHNLAVNLRAEGFYLAQRWEDVVIGATLEFDTFKRNVVQARVCELLAAADALLPGEVQATDAAWAGIRPMSPDGWPMIGPSGDGLFVAAGHSRNGWLLAPITAEIISAYVFGETIKPEWAALSPARFETQ